METMRSKSLSSSVALDRRYVPAVNAVKSFRQAQKMWRQTIRTSRQRGMQRFADLFADGVGMGPVEMDAVWLLARHEGSSCCNSIQLQKQFPERVLVHSGWQSAESERIILVPDARNGGLNA